MEDVDSGTPSVLLKEKEKCIESFYAKPGRFMHAYHIIAWSPIFSCQHSTDHPSISALLSSRISHNLMCSVVLRGADGLADRVR